MWCAPGSTIYTQSSCSARSLCELAELNRWYRQHRGHPVQLTRDPTSYQAADFIWRLSTRQSRRVCQEVLTKGALLRPFAAFLERISVPASLQVLLKHHSFLSLARQLAQPKAFVRLEPRLATSSPQPAVPAACTNG